VKALRFRRLGPGLVQCRPILHLTEAEQNRLDQLAEVSDWSFSEVVEMIVRDWLEQDMAELADLGDSHSYPPPRHGVGFGQ
jgi:hypothetical protein